MRWKLLSIRSQWMKCAVQFGAKRWEWRWTACNIWYNGSVARCNLLKNWMRIIGIATIVRIFHPILATMSHQIGKLFVLNFNGTMCLLQSTGQRHKALMDLLKTFLQIIGCECLWIGQRSYMCFHQFQLLANCQHVRFKFSHQFHEVLKRCGIFELKPGGRFMCLLRNFSLLTCLIRFSTQLFDCRKIWFNIGINFGQGPVQCVQFTVYAHYFVRWCTHYIRSYRFLLICVRFERIDGVNYFLWQLILLHFGAVRLAFNCFRLSCIDVDAA